MARYPGPRWVTARARIIRVADKHGAAAMDAACQRALSVAGKSAPHVDTSKILKRGIEPRSAGQRTHGSPSCRRHEHVRGPATTTRR